jgi:hypothetical protein
VRIIKGGTIKETVDKASPAIWPNGSFGMASYGGNHDLWGQTWVSSDINATTFGVAISATVGPVGGKSGTPTTAEVDAIAITVAYSDAETENRICFASRSVEFSDNGVRRQHVTDDVWGDLVPDGFLLTSPPAGQVVRPVRALIVPSVGDFAARTDAATVKPNATAFYRPGYLQAREAAE